MEGRRVMRGRRGRLTDGSPCMCLGAARTCVILMSSAFCNLTWEFKSRLSSAALVSAGSHISSTENKGEESLSGFRFRQMSHAPHFLPSAGMSLCVAGGTKKKVIWQPRCRHFTTTFLVYGAVTGALTHRWHALW